MEKARRIERFFSQSFFVGVQHTGRPGAYVTIKETIEGFKQLLEDDNIDQIPEEHFLLRGTIDDVFDSYSNQEE